MSTSNRRTDLLATSGARQLGGHRSDHWALGSRQAGVTLIELIIAMVIISIAAVALMQGLGLQSQRNVDPMIQSQAQRLAIQYLQEVSSKPFFDPAADPRLNPFIAADNALVVASIADQTGNASANRLAWDNVFEYDGYNDTIKDLNGTAIAGLVGYQVNIEVSTALGLSLGNAAMANSMDASCPAKIALISVTVTDPRDQETSLSGYRTSYWNAGC